MAAWLAVANAAPEAVNLQLPSQSANAKELEAADVTAPVANPLIVWGMFLGEGIELPIWSAAV
jgi:hypothetical protein